MPSPPLQRVSAICVPDSRGTVHIKSPDHRAQPAIQPNYLMTASDRHVAADSIRITRNIVAQKPLQRFKPEEFKPGPRLPD